MYLTDLWPTSIFVFCPTPPLYPTSQTAGHGVGQLLAVSIGPYNQGVGLPVDTIENKIAGQRPVKCTEPETLTNIGGGQHPRSDPGAYPNPKPGRMKTQYSSCCCIFS